MILQPECDRQANLILSEFRKDRQIDKKIRLISEALAPRLVFTFHVETFQFSFNFELLSTSSNTGRSTSEKCDPRALNAVLVELTLLSSRTELYLRFVNRHITVRKYAFRMRKIFSFNRRVPSIFFF